MKKIFCLFVMFLISNGVNAADKWEYCRLTTQNFSKDGLISVQYVNLWFGEKETHILWKTFIYGSRTEAEKESEKKLWIIAENKFKKMGIIFKPVSKRYDSSMELQDVLGKAGWELVNVIHIRNQANPDGDESVRNVFYFKRKI